MKKEIIQQIKELNNNELIILYQIIRELMNKNNNKKILETLEKEFYLNKKQ